VSLPALIFKARDDFYAGKFGLFPRVTVFLCFL
jgi:hypothetical protein